MKLGTGQYDPYSDSDYFSYGSGASTSKDFTVVRETNWYVALDSAGANTNFYRIEFNKDNVELYLTDFVSELYDDTTKYNSSTNALFNMDIVRYGYRTLTWNETTKKFEPGETTIVKDIFSDEDYTILNTENVTPIDTITNEKGEETIRYKYSLGTTFGSKDVIELYMEDSSGRKVYSFSSYDATTGEYVPFDTTAYKLITGDVMPGGFIDGGYVVDAIVTDDMLDSYYFPERKDYKPFDPQKTPAANKAMPLSQLIPTGGTPVEFGIYAKAFGSPLPGGLPIALVACLFGLGFWYIRRRKAVAA